MKNLMKNITIPVDELARKAAKDWITSNLRFVNPDTHMKYKVELKPGSPELTDIFNRKGRFLGANDTSAAVGYAPMTRLENIVLSTERYANSAAFKKRFPESGEDVKIMGNRQNGKLGLTVSMAFVDKYVENEKDYFRRKDEILHDIESFVKARVDFETVDVKLNTLDKPGRGMQGGPDPSREERTCPERRGARRRGSRSRTAT